LFVTRVVQASFEREKTNQVCSFFQMTKGGIIW